ncbi:MAG: HEAT repeat domain-containing protein [Planctomycetes bacterium]|nr:HEAT repeat domain-containing protein [Planctomycetota bacterium]
MKHVALVFTFAAALAAQGQVPAVQDPQKELAAVIAVEEQERDLAKAEKGYCEAIAGGKLSAQAMQLAQFRLADLLQKLGRDKEAAELRAAAAKAGPIGFDDFGPAPQGQDPEREKALREKAREVVRQLVERHVRHQQQLVPQLAWFGDAAVPEVIATLEAIGAQEHWVNPTNVEEDVAALAGFLWQRGGPKAAAFLAGVAKHPNADFRRVIAGVAHRLADKALLDTAALFLRDSEAEVVKALLRPEQSEGQSLQYRLRPQLLLDAAREGGRDLRLLVFQWAGKPLVQMDREVARQLVALVRDSLGALDAELGLAARRAIGSRNGQSTVEGLELILEQLPWMQDLPANEGSQVLPVLFAPSESRPQRFTREEALRLLPAVTACAQAMQAEAEGLRRPGWSRFAWLASLMRNVAQPLDVAAAPHVLAWTDAGYALTDLLQGRITPANVREVFARFERLPWGRAAEECLRALGEIDLPPDLFPALVRRFEAVRSAAPKVADNFRTPIARTGNPAAADWLLAEGGGQLLPYSLVRLGRRTQHERVKAAMRTVAAAEAPAEGADDDGRSMLILALLAMHDPAALELVAAHNRPVQTARNKPHPYATQKTHFMTPLRYLIEKDPDPPHGFTEDDVIAVLQKIAARYIPHDWEPKSWTVGLIPDRVLGEMARLVVTQLPVRGGREWIREVTRRLDEHREKGEALGPLADWHRQMLSSPGARALALVLENLDEHGLDAVRAPIDALLSGEDEDIAARAARVLEARFGFGGLDWTKRLLGSHHAPLRERGVALAVRLRDGSGEKLLLEATQDQAPVPRAEAAKALGALLSKDAVPRLIELLRDPDEDVRKAAADALTRIRFFHEQQAHWDRVLKGLDASPASAAEKLLLQARPGAPKDQRLLAITSLGALGVPEALPFLIDWTRDTDAEIAAAAKTAITQIHLNPRR